MDRSAIIRALRGVMNPENVSTAPRDLKAVACDESDMPPVMPMCVCRPESTKEVAALVQIAAQEGVPVTARGGGTGLEGGAIPAAGGLVVDFSRMDHILEVAPEEQVAVVQPGVVLERLNRHLRQTGLFFPVSPGGSADGATIGGMVSTDASGTRSLRYGGTRRWVRALEVVLGTGQVVRVGSRVPKSSAGYDTKDLFVGAEGTLGLITEVTLALSPVPPATRTEAFSFPSLEDACEVAAEIAAYVPELVAVELMDSDTLALLRGLPGISSLPEAPVLIVEAAGRPDECAAGLEAATGVAAVHGGSALSEPEDPWAVRERVTRVIRELAKPAGVCRTDCAVPRSALARFVRELKAFVASDRCRTDGVRRRLYVFGHAGVGIVHCLMPLGGPGAWPAEEALAAKAAFAMRALKLGGTVSGEHGIGLGQRDTFGLERAMDLELMRRVKAVCDPHNIMNPGKLFPDVPRLG